MELMLKETQRKRVPSPALGLASLIGMAGDIGAAILPIPPVLTKDQVEISKSDNVPAAGAPGLEALERPGDQSGRRAAEPICGPTGTTASSPSPEAANA